MKIEEFIQGELRKKLERDRALVIYDGERRYRDLVLGLANDAVEVVDASAPVIEARAAAFSSWLDLAANPKRRLVVYVPRSRSDDARQRLADPYLVFVVGGSYFPVDLNDEFKELCRAAFPDQREGIERLFESGEPSLAQVNALKGGSTWPKLSTLLDAVSPTEIVAALLGAESEKRRALDADPGCLDELHRFFRHSFDLPIPAGATSAEAVCDVAWRFLLFSEFAFDLPRPLPNELATVPHAPPSARELVLRVCKRLRELPSTLAEYVERAARVEEELRLPFSFRDDASIGSIETFPFENAAAFRGLREALLQGDFDAGDEVLARGQQSIWRENGEANLAWRLGGLAKAVLAEAAAVEEFLRGLPQPGVAELCTLYADRLHLFDGHYREFLQAWGRAMTEEVFGVPLAPLREEVNRAYGEVSARLQEVFVGAVEREGWPASGFTRHTEVFDRFVKPELDRSLRVGYLLVDALRFDLAGEVTRNLADELAPTTTPVCAILPTKTEAGMAALLPDAGKLIVGASDGQLQVAIEENDVTGALQRDSFWKERYGDRVWTVQLDKFVDSPSRHRPPESARLAVVRSSEIDAAGENAPALLTSAIPDLLIRIKKAVRRLLGELKFDRVVIATDHGFGFLPERKPGDSCTVPPGEWIVAKDRFLLGRGDASKSTVSFAPSSLGIHAEAETMLFPRGLTTFQAGVRYFHGGLSLPECIVPVIVVSRRAKAPKKRSRPWITIFYRGKESGIVTSRVFMLDLSSSEESTTLPFDEMEDADAMEVEIAVLDAESGTAIGRVTESGVVNAATGRIVIRPGEKLRVPVRIGEEFRGTILAKAMDALTGLFYDSVTLRTDFME